MELTQDEYRAAAALAVNRRAYAPRPVIQALGSFADVDDVAASVTMNAEDAGITTWRAMWLTSHCLVFVEATKDDTDWDRDSHDQTPTVVTGWVRPLAEICSIDLIQLVETSPAFGNGRMWKTETRVVFSDGVAVSLPLFGGLANLPDVDAVEDFLLALRRCWPERSG